MWRQWLAFVATFPGARTPTFPTCDATPPPIFSQSFCHASSGRPLCTPNGHPVRSKRVQDYIRTISEEIRLGSPHHLDPTLRPTPSGWTGTCSSSPKATAKQDPSSSQGQAGAHPAPAPCPVRALPDQLTGPVRPGARQTCWSLAYFFLLRPGEYSYDADNNHPFRLQDVTFDTPDGAAQCCNSPRTCPSARPPESCSISLLTQKNGVRDQAITHGNTSDPDLSPLPRRAVSSALPSPASRPRRDTSAHLLLITTGPHGCDSPHDHCSSEVQLHQPWGPPWVIATGRDITARALAQWGLRGPNPGWHRPPACSPNGPLEILGHAGVPSHTPTWDTRHYAARMVSWGVNFVIPTHQKLPADVLTLAQAHLE